MRRLETVKNDGLRRYSIDVDQNAGRIDVRYIRVRIAREICYGILCYRRLVVWKRNYKVALDLDILQDN